MKTDLYRMLCDGIEEWQGRAGDVEHAESRCFYDEPPSSYARYTLQKWGKVRISSSMKEDGWVTVYSNECLAMI